jgi:hypothetical protein
MRRKEKQIVDLPAIESVISKAEICHLALSVNDRPYVVPLCFGYQAKTLYFHSAAAGKKLEMIRANPQVCFELVVDNRIITADQACNWSMKYKSVIGFGKASVIEDKAERTKALTIIMKQYADQSWEFKPSLLEKTVLIRVEIEEMTGKQSLD